MAVRFNLPILAFDDANGNPLAGGFIEFYDTQSSNAKDVWEDDDLSIPAQNIDPNVVGSTGYELDSSGRHGDIFLEPGDYKVVVKNALGVIIKTMDPVHGSADDSLTSYYDLPINLMGQPDDGEVYPVILPVRPLLLPAGLDDGNFAARFALLTNPTSTAVWTMFKNASSIGTISFSTSGVPTVSFPLDVTLAAIDTLTFVAPSPQDATAEGFIAMIPFIIQ